MNSTIQRILVPLDPSPYAQAAVLRACDVAHRHYAQVTGLAVLDSPEIRRRFAPTEISHWPSIRDNLDTAFQQAEEVIAKTREHFAMTCEAQHVAYIDDELTGVPASVIPETASLYDLIVMGLRTYYHFETRDADGDSLDRILDRTASPVLAVPATTDSPFKRVLIAYDGSLPSARALRDFVGFAQPFEFEITVFSCGEDKEQSNALLRRAATYLRAHGINQFETQGFTRAPWDVVREEFLGRTDLVVAGIHSRRFLVDPIVGSFTRSLIQSGRVSLFLSH
jgi:nucleotide-binding universal stress UspA family protein